MQKTQKIRNASKNNKEPEIGLRGAKNKIT